MAVCLKVGCGSWRENGEGLGDYEGSSRLRRGLGSVGWAKREEEVFERAADGVEECGEAVV